MTVIAPISDLTRTAMMSQKGHERPFALWKNSEPSRRLTAVKSVTDLPSEA